MSLQDEINKQKQFNNATTQQKRIAHQNEIKDTQKMIPAIAEYAKNMAVSMAAREETFASQIHREFFSRRWYMDCDIRIRSDEHIVWYYSLCRCPEVYGDLIREIESKGLKNVKIGKNEYYPAIVINAQIDLR